MKKIQLTMFVSQQNTKTDSIRREFDELLQSQYGDDYQLEVVNVLHMPEKAVEHEVFVTPTLVRTFPEPIIRLLGNLSDSKSVLTKIDIQNNGGAETIII